MKTKEKIYQKTGDAVDDVSFRPKSIEIGSNWILQETDLQEEDKKKNGDVTDVKDVPVAVETENQDIQSTTARSKSQPELAATDGTQSNGLKHSDKSRSKSLPWLLTTLRSKLRKKARKMNNPAWDQHTQEEDLRWLQWVEKQFSEIAGEDQEIDLQEFKKALNVKKSFFAERFFALFDKDGSGTIELTELMDGLNMLSKGSAADKLRFLFDVYDVDGSGTISPEELKTVLRSCMEESSLQLSEENLEALTMALFTSADEDGSGEISFDELKEELEKHPGIIENLTISAAKWMKPPENSKKDSGCLPRYFSRRYLQNNVRKVVFLLIYWLINAGLFTLSAVRYRHKNWCLIIARGNGMTLNFNCMFILVLMLRKCLTYLRGTFLSHYLPLDQNILFHKMVGVVIAVQSTLHTMAHLGNVWFLMQTPDNKFAYWEYLFTIKPNIGWVSGLAPLSGVILVIVLAVMVVCSMPFVRRKGHFQVFYWTHMLYVVFWVLLILHGPLFWMFFCVPGLVFIIEKLLNSEFVKIARFGRTYIQEVNLLPSKVTHLVVSRPENFRYSPGDYVFIRIPEIAQHEWHPFTISSAPEMKGHIWLHVRSAGHWTNKLYQYFDDYAEVDEKKRKEMRKKNKNSLSLGAIEEGHDIQGTSIKHTGDALPKLQQTGITKTESVKIKLKKSSNLKVDVRVLIDGPYGTPTREIFETEHAVLVASGIGVTPFASILQSVMYRYKNSKRTCPQCSHAWYDEVPENVMKLKKVDFIWINRDQKCFEWFVSLLARIEMEQTTGDEADRLIDMHMYMTAALGKSDMKGLGLQMALEILHKKEQRDLITGLQTRTQAGRPDWDQIFTKIASERKGKVKVFFCGSPALGKVLKRACERFKFSFCKENF